MASPKDTFSKQTTLLDGPASNAYSISSSSSANVAYTTRGIFVGTGGNLEVTMLKGIGKVIFYNIPSGAILPIRVIKVWASNTTANNIVGLV
jgi:hypothetical protein